MDDRQVYITQYNFNCFLKKIDLNKVKLAEKSIIEKNLKPIFNIYELRWLKLYQTAMEEPAQILNEAYVKQVPVDNDRYMYYSPPAYHVDEHCTNLNARFENIFIPEPVRLKGHSAVEWFRDYYKKNTHLYENNRAAFMAHVEIKLGVKIYDLEHVEADNSGSQTLDRLVLLSAEEIQIKIDLLLDEMNQYRNSSPEITKEISQYGYATYKARKHNKDGKYELIIADKDSPLYKWHNYKSELNKLIQEYCRASLNPHFAFDVPIVEEIGFRPCKACCNNISSLNLANTFNQPPGGHIDNMDNIPF